MANHREPVPEWLNASYMQNSMRFALKNQDILIRKIEVTPGSNVGDNYLGQIFRIKMFYKDDVEKTMSVIAKYHPSTKLMNDVGEECDIFVTEALFFSKILPQLKEFGEFSKEFAPVTHFIDLEKKIIIMEDLVEKGFYMYPRNTFLNKEKGIIALEALAKLHGSSYYLLQKDPSIPGNCKGMFWSENKSPVTYKFTDNGLRAIENLVDTYGFSNEWTTKLKGMKARLINDGWFKVCNLREDRLNFILHGDCWINNMMFHDTEGKTDDIRLFDYQIFYFGSFANELQYFIFCSLDVEVILNDLDFLLEYYYNKLKEVAPEIPNLTFDRIKSEFAERYFFGFITSLIFRALTIAEVPPDGDKIFNGELEDTGFKSEKYISDLRKLLQFFEKEGVF